MSEKNGYLGRGEKIVLSTHPSLVILFARLISLFLGIVALVIIFAVGTNSGFNILSDAAIRIVIIATGLFVAFVTYISWAKTTYIVTNVRVRYYSGVLGIQNKDMTLEDVQNVQYQQSFLGTVLNYGDIFIRSAAEDKPIVFQNIPAPRKYANLIRTLAKV